jgi:hypothetical protein
MQGGIVEAVNANGGVKSNSKEEMDDDLETFKTHGFFTGAEFFNTIAWKEAIAVLRTLEEVEDFIRNEILEIHVDNQNVLFWLRRWRCRKPIYRLVICKIRDLLLSLGIEVSDIFYVRSEDNVIADEISRDVLQHHDTWELDNTEYKRICKDTAPIVELEKPQIDFFATRKNSKCDLYYARYYEKSALAIESLAQKWSQWKYAYANIPFRLADKVIDKWLRDAPEFMLILLPDWKRLAHQHVICKMHAVWSDVLEPNPKMFKAGVEHFGGIAPRQ